MDERAAMRTAVLAWKAQQGNGNGFTHICFVCGQPCTSSEAWTTSYIAEADIDRKAICPVHGRRAI